LWMQLSRHTVVRPTSPIVQEAALL
jgi:hypothetical protein